MLRLGLPLGVPAVPVAGAGEPTFSPTLQCLLEDLAGSKLLRLAATIKGNIEPSDSTLDPSVWMLKLGLRFGMVQSGKLVVLLLRRFVGSKPRPATCCCRDLLVCFPVAVGTKGVTDLQYPEPIKGSNKNRRLKKDPTMKWVKVGLALGGSGFSDSPFFCPLSATELRLSQDPKP